MSTARTALLIRCTQEEAERIRHAAKRERRTLSGFIVNAVLNRIESRERAFVAFEQTQRQRTQADATDQGR